LVPGNFIIAGSTNNVTNSYVMTQSTNASQTITIQPTGADGVAFQVNATNGSNVINVNTQSNTLNVTNNGAGIVTNYVEVPIEIITGPTVLSPFGISVIDGYTGSYNVTLPTGPTGSTKIVSLMNGAGYPVTVNTAQGSFSVSVQIPNRILYAFNNQLSTPWVIASDNNASFFTTKQQANLAAVSNPASVALSQDGNIAVVGVPLYSTTGAFEIWQRSNGVWSLVTRTAGTPSTVSASQGVAVAVATNPPLAAVGTIAVSAPFDGTTGSVFIFIESGGVWSQQAKISPSDSVGAAQFGSSVALSSDGNTLVVGGPDDSTNVGATWVYTRSGVTWTEVAKLTGAGSSGAAHQGYSVSVAADGTSLVTGGPYDNSSTGAIWVFTNQSGTWTQQGYKLVVSSIVGSAFQGGSVAMNEGGDIIVVGGQSDNSAVGGAWVWEYNNGIWLNVGVKLSAYAVTALQGYSVAISADGNTIIVGAPLANSVNGTIVQYTRVRNRYVQQPILSVTSPSGNFGGRVAISADGSTVIGGAINITSSGVWVFV
jgi:hypothetical protein